MYCMLPRIQATNLVLWCSRRYALSFHFILLIVCYGIAHPSTNYSGQLLVQYLHCKEAARSNNTERATTSLYACIGPMHSKNRHQREVGRDGSGGQTLRAGVLSIGTGWQNGTHGKYLDPYRASFDGTLSHSPRSCRTLSWY